MLRLQSPKIYQQTPFETKSKELPKLLLTRMPLRRGPLKMGGLMQDMCIEYRLIVFKGHTKQVANV